MTIQLLKVLREGRHPALMNGERAVVDHDVTAIASVVTSGNENLYVLQLM